MDDDGGYTVGFWMWSGVGTIVTDHLLKTIASIAVPLRVIPRVTFEDAVDSVTISGVRGGFLYGVRF